MAEAIGLIASVITISKTLVTAVEVVRSLYQAEAELKRLQVSDVVFTVNIGHDYV